MLIHKLGRYQIESQLGRGAMGTVYKALDPAIERTVAIKTLNPDLPEDTIQEVRERFLREAKSAGKLNHPNVVTIYDVGEADGIAYIAMEYLEGRSLRQILDSGSLLAARSIANVIAQVADALDYAHLQQIVHRDIKPANIMLLPSGHAKLADFGVAHMASSSMTQTGTVLGSPKYLSPEQVLGQKPDGRADIFALGVVLYEMLCGRTPFEIPDITVFTLMQRIVTEPVPPARGFRPDLPEAFDAILARALAKNPDERYARASRFAADLRAMREPASATLEKTVVMPAAGDATVRIERTVVSAQPGTATRLKPREDLDLQSSMDSLLKDLETFSSNFDLEQARQREEAEARAREAQAAAAQLSATQEKSAGEHAPGKAKSALLGMLREQAQAKNRSKQPSREPSFDAALLLDANLRAAFRYLVEFVNQFNAATPEFMGKLNLMYVGALPPLTLGNGFVDFRTSPVNDKPLVDHISLFYRMQSTRKLAANLNREEARILKEMLDRSEMKCDMRDDRSAPGKVPRVAFDIDCNLPARAAMQADYRQLSVLIECRNVGALGSAKYRLAAVQWNEEAVEEFGKLALGLPNQFSQYRVFDGIRSGGGRPAPS